MSSMYRSSRSAWVLMSAKGPPIENWSKGTRSRAASRAMAQVEQAESETCGSITKWSMRKDEAFRWAHWRNPPAKQPNAAPFNVSRALLQTMAKVENWMAVYHTLVPHFLAPCYNQALFTQAWPGDRERWLTARAH